MSAKTCEICGDVVHTVVRAECGHETYLCDTCKDECPGALRLCLVCEEIEASGGDDE